MSRTLFRSLVAAWLFFALPALAVAQPPGAANPMAITGPPSAGASPATAMPGPSAPVFSGPSGDRAYILGVGDTIDVSILGRSDFSTHARIGSDGAVLLPYIGPVPATERSPAQLAEQIASALEKGGFFSHPAVRVDVVGVSSRYVTVLGAVSAPGLISLDRQYRLSEIMARVGGKEGAGVDHVVLTHENGTSQEYKLVDLATGGGDKDPVVVSGDKVYVPPPDNSVVYVTGQVKTPGAYPVTPHMSVRLALARAGGVNENGSEKKVSINRAGKKIKAGDIDKTTVEAGDILSVGERLF